MASQLPVGAFTILVAAAATLWLFQIQEWQSTRRILKAVVKKGTRIMALGQDILDAVKASRESQDQLSNSVAQLSASVDSIIAKVEAMAASGAITPEQAAEIIGTARADREGADTANASAQAANQKIADELTKLGDTTPTGN